METEIGLDNKLYYNQLTLERKEVPYLNLFISLFSVYFRECAREADGERPSICRLALQKNHQQLWFSEDTQPWPLRRLASLPLLTPASGFQLEGCWQLAACRTGQIPLQPSARLSCGSASRVPPPPGAASAGFASRLLRSVC